MLKISGLMGSFLFVFSLFLINASGAVWVVTKTADTNDGRCDVDCSLREAIAVANNGDVISFSSLFDQWQQIVLTGGELRVVKSITITGKGANLLTINANNAAHTSVFNINSQNATLNGMTITGGNKSFAGGGITSTGLLYLRNLVIAGNRCSTAPDSDVGCGGGLQIDGGAVALVNSTISNNTGNSLECGGGILLSFGSIIIVNSTISQNTAGNHYAGGGLRLRQPASATIINSTISGNKAGGYESGGGIRSQGTLSLINTTISNNQGVIWPVPQSNFAGGVRLAGGSTTIRNTILAGNTGTFADAFGSVISQGNNLIGSTNFMGGLVDTDLRNLSPQLAPLGSYGGPTQTHALLANSPAIDGGSNTPVLDPLENVPLTTDQRGFGFPRIISQNADIGAFESNGTAVPGPPVVISGRILVSTGRPAGKTLITLTNPANGLTRLTTTNPFGHYRFENLEPNIGYQFSFRHKRISIAPTVVFVTMNDHNINFTADF